MIIPKHTVIPKHTTIPLLLEGIFHSSKLEFNKLVFVELCKLVFAELIIFVFLRQVPGITVAIYLSNSIPLPKLSR